ncbi:hypothetical protein D6774_02050 [Candidatus Woesearchaeota archaeon]|nr:MAG: hypothetical protein D6774_02050 [Candidatus Woesearchaeota archaeon]
MKPLKDELAQGDKYFDMLFGLLKRAEVLLNKARSAANAVGLQATQEKVTHLTTKVRAVFSNYKRAKELLQQIEEGAKRRDALTGEERKQEQQRLEQLLKELHAIIDPTIPILEQEAQIAEKEIDPVIKRLASRESRAQSLAKKGRYSTVRELAELIAAKGPENKEELQKILHGKKIQIKGHDFTIARYQFFTQPAIHLEHTDEGLWLHVDLEKKDFVEEDMQALERFVNTLIQKKKGMSPDQLTTYLEELVRQGLHDQALAAQIEGKKLVSPAGVSTTITKLVHLPHKTPPFFIALDALPSQLVIPATPSIIAKILSHIDKAQSLQSKLEKTYIGSIENYIKGKDRNGKQLHKKPAELYKELKDQWGFNKEELELLIQLSHAQWI